jgi:hypothetical protein
MSFVPVLQYAEITFPNSAVEEKDKRVYIRRRRMEDDTG